MDSPASERGFVQRTLSSLRSRNFRLFFVGQTVSNTGNWLTMVALTLLVLKLTDNGVAIGFLAAAQFGVGTERTAGGGGRIRTGCPSPATSGLRGLLRRLALLLIQLSAVLHQALLLLTDPLLLLLRCQALR